MYSETAGCDTDDYSPPRLEPWTVDPSDLGNRQVYVDSLLAAGISNKLSQTHIIPVL